MSARLRRGMPVSGEQGAERLVAGRYRLLSPLGEGGMGTVWRARDELLNREVAVKEVRAPAGLPTSDVERMYARLEREAWAAARISHRNVVTVYDVATEDGRPWIVMELVRGISLAELLETEGPLTPQRTAQIGVEVLAALRAAHEAGVLHRDVKPANVLLSNDGRVVLTDFGIARVEGSSALTMTGEVIGSPEFLPPERALGRTPGPESDLWSLGVLLYAGVEGSSPFRQATPLSTLRAIVEDELPPPHRAGPLAPVIEGLLRKDPAERLTAEQAERDLRVVGAGGAPSANTVRAVPYPTAPTRPLPSRQEPSTPPWPGPAAGARTTPATPLAPPDERRPDRDRRAVVVLAAGVLALALAVGGLTYVLLNKDKGGGDGGRNTATESGGLTPGTSAPTTSAGQPTPSATPSSSAPTSATPPQTVDITLTGKHTDYTGSCPPSDADAPTFTATFTVGRLPAEVDYRWVSKNGKISDSGWKTLSFPEGGARSRQDRVIVTTYSKSGTFSNEISVEVRDPVHRKSEPVPFTVTCVKETPSDEVSSSPSVTP
ncbi:protein kinase domain-containing protein [Streptomyces adustus]